MLVWQRLAALGRTFFAADFKPAFALASVLPCTSVFRGSTKTLPFAAADTRASNLDHSSAFVGACNDSTCDEQECDGGRDRARLRVHFQISAPEASEPTRAIAANCSYLHESLRFPRPD